MIVPGSATQSLAVALADALDEPLCPVEFERFPDGELLARVPDRDDHAVVVASTVSSDAHVELLQLQDAASEQADRVTTVIPYLGYARQDEAFKAGDPVSARAMARAVSTGTDRVVTVNLHEDHVLEFFDVPATGVDAASVLAEPLPTDLEEPLFVGPDESATDVATTVRDAYGRGATDYFEKTRDHDTGDVTLEPSGGAVGGRDVVIVDDIVATGSTMAEAVRQLHEEDCGRVFAVCVHPMLAENARTKLARAGVEAVYGTDTIERTVSAVSAAEPIANALRELD